MTSVKDIILLGPLKRVEYMIHAYLIYIIHVNGHIKPIIKKGVVQDGTT